MPDNGDKEDLLRDIFAGAALMGILNNEGPEPSADGQAIQCNYAFAYADAMMKAREE